ncbi:hypothetical protein [Psychroserpens sp. Hel_I_66]|uniref:hypothetical protein n=1 Tax=Psychroserpens sp. Hel_I_66 TaxID=1250004 RepID=UPI000645AB28|nr:hypothetical protein [Psychroserpens sp. Hel_I_66]
MNDKTRKILTDISTVTRDIEENYPELQKYLDETQSTLPQGGNQEAEINEKELKSYLEELKKMISEYNSKH